MSLGFRKSFFGYNCEEVTEFIHKSNSEHKDVVSALNQNIKNLENDVRLMQTSIDNVNSEKVKLEEKLDYYIAKYNEVKNLSENIGKLYLVAQTNAKSIMSAANLAKDATREHLDEDIKTIDNANESLNNLKERINALNDDFCNNVNMLTDSLSSIKDMIENCDENSKEKNQEFKQVFNQITK